MTESVAQPRTIKEEMEAGRRLTDDFGWPTVFLFLGLFAMFFFAIWASMTGLISYFWGAVINTVFIYALYTVVHEAIHGNISSRRKNLRWVDLVVGQRPVSHCSCSIIHTSSNIWFTTPRPIPRTIRISMRAAASLAGCSCGSPRR